MTMVTWAHERRLQLRQFQPGKPNQNDYIKSLNGLRHDECLPERWFSTLLHARSEIETGFAGLATGSEQGNGTNLIQEARPGLRDVKHGHVDNVLRPWIQCLNNRDKMPCSAIHLASFHARIDEQTWSA